MNLGQNTAAGFLPSVPSSDDVLNLLRSKSGGWDEINNSQAGKAMQSNGPDAAEDLHKCYAQIYAMPAGRRVVEDIVSMTLHRSPFLNNEKGEFSLEQNIAYGLERKGQNGLAIAILAKIVKGQGIVPGKKTRKK
jgi:hypothetical protein